MKSPKGANSSGKLKTFGHEKQELSLLDLVVLFGKFLFTHLRITSIPSFPDLHISNQVGGEGEILVHLVYHINCQMEQQSGAMDGIQLKNNNILETHEIK